MQIFPTSEIELTPETIAAIGGIQQALRTVNIGVEVVDKAPRGGDTLVLGTFTPSDDLAEFTDPFDIEVNEGDGTIIVKKFGEIKVTGNGLLLFEQSKTGNTLTLLSDTQENLISLLTTLGSGSLSGCVLQDNIAVCGVGYGGTSGETTEGTPKAEPTSGESTPAPENATPEPAVTPLG